MFKYKNKAFYVSRTESGAITLTSDDKPFNVGDTIEFKIYNQEALDDTPLLVKEYEVSEEGLTAVIELSGADTDLGDPSNEVITFWYEIRLNGDKVLMGYDDTGAKLFYLYPTGVDSQ